MAGRRLLLQSKFCGATGSIYIAENNKYFIQQVPMMIWDYLLMIIKQHHQTFT